MNIRSEIEDYPVTYSLIVLSVSVFILQKAVPNFTNLFAFYVRRNTVELAYTSVTYVFLHTGLVHLLGNLIGLWFLGRNAEEIIGSLDAFSLALFTTVIVPILVGFAQILELVPIKPLVGISAVNLAFGGLVLAVQPYASATRPGKKISFKFEGWKKHFLKSADSVMLWIFAILVVNAFQVLQNSSYLGHVLGGVIGIAIGLLIRKDVS